VNVVASLDLLFESGTLLHRVGRCGRFATDGLFITFYKCQENKKIEEIHQVCKIEFEQIDW
jgi:superfamily II DNA/RNA helicase